MKLPSIISREVEALRREREWNKYDSHTLESLIDRLDEYPSIRERVMGFYYKLVRGKDRVVEFPRKVKNFIHRGKHGWATPDTWSADYTLAKQLDGLFTEFRRVNIAHPYNMSEDEWDNILDVIVEGFRQYHQMVDKDWNIDWDADSDRINRTVEEKDAEFEEAHKAVQRSLSLMGEHWPALWW